MSWLWQYHIYIVFLHPCTINKFLLGSGDAVGSFIYAKRVSGRTVSGQTNGE